MTRRKLSPRELSQDVEAEHAELAAQAGGARRGVGALRVAVWSALAMGVTALAGRLVA
jgi:hypothetical protein